jgi:hypothetical protein
MKYYFTLFCFTVLFVITSCSDSVDMSFNPITNFKAENNTVVLDMDLDSVIVAGIAIPSVKQTPTGNFEYSFKFIHKDNKKYFYKIYYQNESYKFPENDSLSYENFYGSWEDVSVGFIPIETKGEITGSFRIVGNPRNEKIYYGADLSSNNVSKEKVQTLMKNIRSVPDWFNAVVEKANKNGNSVDKQLYFDAMWIINNNRNTGDENHRWKRNPRVGEYSFMLVVCDESALQQIPDYIQYIGKTNEAGSFINPYSWFFYNKKEGINVVVSDKKLKTRAVLSPKNGVFVDETTIRNADYSFDTTDSRCGINDDVYKKAVYQQFFSAVSRQYTLRNIPLIRDVVSDTDPYTMEEYKSNAGRYDSSELLYDYPYTTECPCKTVKISENGDYIELVNPGNSDMNNLKKESTGIKTRVGFTYGKYRGKIKFPVMLNEENVWNGLTYAFWLIYQDNHEWNIRRGCYEGGYIDKGDDTPTPVRMLNNKYSEIDIEIVKTSKYWPKNYYKRRNNVTEDATQTDEVMYCCTNWDLACPQPEKFSAGITSIPYKDATYEAMRWTNLYKALTIKTPIANDVFKENYYYYEIEWKPTEIIWRVGETPDNMRVVGYMNDKYTSIPNNQMLAIVTQEYHYSEWWPPIAFEQGLIPYNQSDIEGRVYEIVIE